MSINEIEEIPTNDEDLDKADRLDKWRMAVWVLALLLVGAIAWLLIASNSASEDKALSEASQKFTLAQQVAAACAVKEQADDLGGLCASAKQIVQEGPAGTTGIQGPPGDVGPQGPLGPKGEQGVQGIQGLLGARGVLGAPGAPGGPGIPGAVGDSGATGATGAAGVDGPIGPIGPIGPAGANAPQIDAVDCSAPLAGLTITVHVTDGTSFTATCTVVP